MGEQVIISIGREFGSAGHEIAAKLAAYYKLPLYDHNLLDHIAEEGGLNSKELKDFDEKKRNMLLTRTVKGMTNSPAYHVANLQFDFLRKKAESGESFVVVGRCSDFILKNYPGFISIFVLGDMDKKIERVMRVYDMSKEEARAFIVEKDRKRKKYHNSYCDIRWGDSRGYDLSINSSKLGEEECMRILVDYIDTRKKVGWK